MTKKQTNETTLKDKTIQRLVSNGWALQSAHEVWEEIALAVQQERERIANGLEEAMAEDDGPDTYISLFARLVLFERALTNQEDQLIVKE